MTVKPPVTYLNTTTKVSLRANVKTLQQTLKRLFQEGWQFQGFSPKKDAWVFTRTIGGQHA